MFFPSHILYEFLLAFNIFTSYITKPKMRIRKQKKNDGKNIDGKDRKYSNNNIYFSEKET